MDVITNRLRVPPEDIDSYDHVNCGKYLKYYQEGQESLLRAYLGVDYKGLEERFGVRAVIRRSEIDYFHELFAGDDITILTTVDELGKTSMTYKQSIQRGPDTASAARFTSVFTNLKGVPIPIPEDIKRRLP